MEITFAKKLLTWQILLFQGWLQRGMEVVVPSTFLANQLSRQHHIKIATCKLRFFHRNQFGSTAFRATTGIHFYS